MFLQDSKARTTSWFGLGSAGSPGVPNLTPVSSSVSTENSFKKFQQQAHEKMERVSDFDK